jgi:hypothetical protein
MRNQTCRLLALAPGLYLLLNGGLLWCSPRWFVQVHNLPFYPPRFKRGMDAIAAHERASRAVGLVATLGGAVYLLLVTARRAC